MINELALLTSVLACFAAGWIFGFSYGVVKGIPDFMKEVKESEKEHPPKEEKEQKKNFKNSRLAIDYLLSKETPVN